ncbi:MAG: hypothetical protein IJA15_03380 [Clostridia bacterium]|nr:hypothetical protein [Clostridia bacterium]
MDIILAEAKKLGMQVWLLDDDKFPTGHAGGAVAKNPDLRKWLLIERHVDIVGPAEDISLLLDEENEENILIGAYAYKRNADFKETCEYKAVDLTQNCKNGFLHWDVPSGVWRVFFYFKSRKGGRKEYIDMINPDSVKLLIDTVYESHYQHYKQYFGTTFMGFFSDEPEFGNEMVGQQRFDFGYYQAKIGKHGLSLPYNEEVLARMQKSLGYNPIEHFNLLWYEDDNNGNDQAELRYAYMDAITQLYSECFTGQLAKWCKEHGVIYTGHIIEDMNCHLRNGAGHYFRAIREQHISGIDIVLHQVMPGMDHYIHTVTCATGVGDGTFYHYVLAKLASSISHLTPHMQGRAMCEVFGAYGYGESTPFMKYLLDHLLVRGINYFVPHAFSSKFPDGDCPPHFGAEGQDPSFEGFSALMSYANKAAHLLSGGVHKANVAIMYDMEGEWPSRFDNAMTMQPIATTLHDNQIDFDIVCLDILKESTVQNGKLCAHGESFDLLVVPYADHLSQETLKVFKAMHDSGLPIYFINALPENINFKGEYVKIEELANKIRKNGWFDICIEGEHPYLRFYHTVRDGKHIFMFSNEDYKNSVNTTVKLPVSGDFARIDLLSELYSAESSDNGNLQLNLAPLTGEIIIFDKCEGLPKKAVMQEIMAFTPKFTLELANCKNLDKFETVGTFDKFFNVNGASFKPDFSGKMKYTFDFELKEFKGRIFMDLCEVGQNASLTVNGVNLGVRPAKPYLFEITGAVKQGVNKATVIVGNTLAQEVKDRFSKFLQLEPSGILKEIKLFSSK